VTGDVDIAAVLRSQDAFTSGWDDAGQVWWLEAVDVDHVRWHGRIVGERVVEVTAGDGTVTRLEARRRVVIGLGTGISGTAQLVIIDADRRVILGSTFVGPGFGDMIHDED
jgi:pyruvate/2-oxoglutarate dehydrogenase complex dihydrolipoamide dehydrogenase (E3) component